MLCHPKAGAIVPPRPALPRRGWRGWDNGASITRARKKTTKKSPKVSDKLNRRHPTLKDQGVSLGR